MKAWLQIINDFAHDLFTGLWIASFVGLWIVHGKAELAAQVGAMANALVQQLLLIFFVLQSQSLIIVIITGIFRFMHQRAGIPAPDPQIKNKILIIKHAVLGSLFLGGSIVGILWVR